MAALDEEQRAKVMKQLEFYFSDSNLPKDRFLKSKVKEDPEGYVQLRIVLAFARMREFLKLTVTKPEEVADNVITAVADLIKQKSKLLQVDESGTKLRRVQAIEDEEKVSAEVDARSLYAKPFQHDVNIDQLNEFFSKHAPVNSVRMRRMNSSKAFKGSVFVEFASVADMEKVLSKSLEFGGAPLHLEKKAEYMQRKQEAAKTRPLSKRKRFDDDDFSNDELPDGVGGTVGGPIVQPAVVASTQQPAETEEQRATKRARTEEEIEEEGGEGDGEEGEGEEGGGEGDEAEGGGVAEDKCGFAQPKGLLLGFKLEEALPETGATRLVTDLFGGRPVVKYVELSKDHKAGTIRFVNAEAADQALAAFNAKAKDDQRIGPAAGQLYKVQGEEEEQYMQRAKAAHNAAQGSGRRGGRAGRGRGRGRGRGGRGRGYRGRR